MTQEKKSGSWEIRAKFSEYTEQWCCTSSTRREWGTHIEQTCSIPSSSVKMCLINIFRMCRSSASLKWMNDVLFNHHWHGVDVNIRYNSFQSPTYMLNLNQHSAIYKCWLWHLWMVESCNISFWKASFKRAIGSTFDFFNLTQNFTEWHCSVKTSIFLFTQQRTVWKHALFPHAH